MSDSCELIVAIPCPYCMMVLEFIKENNLDFITVTDTNWDQKAHDNLRESYGKSQVPLLLVNHSPIYESSDIIKFLKDTYL
jgi:glutaredoxin 3